MTILRSLPLFPLLPLTLLTLTACNSSEDPMTSPTQRLTEITRNLADGTVISQKIEYDSFGNLQSEVSRRNGAVYLTSSYESTDEGQLIRRSDDNNQDGVEDRSSTYLYQDGLGLRRINRVDTNGLIYEIDVFQFDGSVAVSRDTQDIDDVAQSELVDETSGTLKTRRLYVYENERLSEVNIDSNGNGETNRQEVLSYNPNGTLATSTLNSTTDGVVSSALYVYEPGKCNNNAANSFTTFYCVTTELVLTIPIDVIR